MHWQAEQVMFHCLSDCLCRPMLRQSVVFCVITHQPVFLGRPMIRQSSMPQRMPLQADASAIECTRVLSRRVGVALNLPCWTCAGSKPAYPCIVCPSLHRASNGAEGDIEDLQGNPCKAVKAQGCKQQCCKQHCCKQQRDRHPQQRRWPWGCPVRTQVVHHPNRRHLHVDDPQDTSHDFDACR